MTSHLIVLCVEEAACWVYGVDIVLTMDVLESCRPWEVRRVEQLLALLRWLASDWTHRKSQNRLQYNLQLRLQVKFAVDVISGFDRVPPDMIAIYLY